jgi:secreted Zn-dependent insulinase-like peptidase
MKDDKFERPKAHVSVKIYTNDNEFGINPKRRVFANVWKNAQDEYLREFKYMADCANLDFNVSLSYDNLNFGWSGFNDSMPSYISESISKLS